MSAFLVTIFILVIILLIAYFAYKRGRRDIPTSPPKPLPAVNNTAQVGQPSITKPASPTMSQRQRNAPIAPSPIQHDARTEQLERNLRTKCFGDKGKMERLIQYEATRAPNASRATWIQNAIERWERDNR